MFTRSLLLVRPPHAQSRHLPGARPSAHPAPRLGVLAVVVLVAAISPLTSAPPAGASPSSDPSGPPADPSPRLASSAPKVDQPAPTPTADWMTVQRLIDESSDGDTLVIPAGTYIVEKPVSIKDRKGLTLTSASQASILLTDTDAPVVLIEGSSGITLSNLLLRHLEPQQEYTCHGAVVEVENSTNVVISNCILNGSGAIGVSARGASDLEIANCIIEENSFMAFVLIQVDDVLIRANIIRDNAGLMQLNGVRFMEMRDNLIHGNGGYWSDDKEERRPGLRLR
jgi:hypothetical protein